MSVTVGVLLEARSAYPLRAPECTPGFFWWGRVANFFVLSYYVSLRSEFRVVMSLTISA